MSVIEGASVAVRTMADGTLRLTVDIEPRNAQAAFALFGSPGTAMALAALLGGTGAAGVPPVDDTHPESEPPKKGGEWAKLAGMWCADPDFWTWANSQTFNGESWQVVNPNDAAHMIRTTCDIDSRAELDHDSSALARFNSSIRHPFMKWMQARGIQK